MKIGELNLSAKLLQAVFILYGAHALAQTDQSLPTSTVKPNKVVQQKSKKNPDAQQIADESDPRKTSPVTSSSSRSTASDPDAPTADLNTAPYGGLYETYKEEFSTERSEKEAQKRAAKAQKVYEEKKAEMDREVIIRKRKIQDLKQSKEDADVRVQALETELGEIDKKQKETEAAMDQLGKQSDEIIGLAEDKKRELQNARTKLNASVEQMKLVRERAQKNFFKARVETQHLESEIAILEADTAALDADLHETQTAELKARVEWQEAKAQAEEHRAGKTQAQKDLNEAKTRLVAAQKDLANARAELTQIEKDRNGTDKNVADEVRRLDDLTANANKARTLAEMEKVKVESEIEKIKAYGDNVKKSNADAMEAMRNAQYDLMESRVSLETIKSSLVKDAANGEKIKIQNARSAENQRTVASADRGPSDQDKMYTLSHSCEVHERAATKSDKISDLQAGTKTLATPWYGGWVRVRVGGKIGFIKTDCGDF